ncbi:MAG: photosynthetic complex assembly protein PuhC [Gemmatimonadaceae bacterium]
MSYIHIDEDHTDTPNAGVPKGALILAGSFALVVIALAAVARLSGNGTLGEQPHATMIASRALVFTDRPDGSIGVYDSQHQVELESLPGGNGGFVRGTLRAMARQRRLSNVGPELPFYLAKWSDGRLTLDDSSTRTHLELNSYGSTNEESFEKVLIGNNTPPRMAVTKP